jgi:hypothetical protein
MYDPKVGRFLSEDPSGLADGVNVYAYVHNNPMNNVDPTGLSSRPTQLGNAFSNVILPGGGDPTLRVGITPPGPPTLAESAAMSAPLWQMTADINAGKHLTDDLPPIVGPAPKPAINPQDFWLTHVPVSAYHAELLRAEDEMNSLRWKYPNIIFPSEPSSGELWLEGFTGLVGGGALSASLKGVDELTAVSNYTDDIRVNFNVYETIWETAARGTSRHSHRRYANLSLYEALQNDAELRAMFDDVIPGNVLEHMESGMGRSLLNPPGTVWHHPVDNVDVVQLLFGPEHANSQLQHVLHPNGVGGYGVFYSSD